MFTPDNCPKLTTGRSDIVDPQNAYQRPKSFTLRPPDRITHIVVHILGNSWEGGFNRFINQQDASIHYVIKTDGTITQFAPETARAGHAGLFPLVMEKYLTGDPDIWMRYVEVSTEASVRFGTYPNGKPRYYNIKTGPPPGVPVSVVRDQDSTRLYWERKDGIWEDFDYFKTRFPDLKYPYNFLYEGKGAPKLGPGQYNEYTFGIELAGAGGPKESDYPRGIYVGLDKVLGYLCPKYGIPRTREFIIGHEDVNPIARWGWDPGRGFQWDNVCPRNRYYFPLSGPKKTVPPVAQYLNNEDPSTGKGGTYVTGLGRTLHGGVHLFAPPGDTNVPVRCMAPGYIVAVRLPGKNTPATAPAVLDMAENWTGFVLVRHEFEDPKHLQAGKPRVLTLYSLYMHLASPDYANLFNDPYVVAAGGNPGEWPVPWFGDLFRKRFGSWIRVGGGKDPAPGTVVWSKEAFSSTTSTYHGFDFPDRIVPEEAGRVEWVFRPPPVHYKKVLEALEQGKVVTFPEPFFRIKSAGEAIGLLRPISGTSASRAAPKPGSFHWEVFAPVQGSAGSPASSLREILKLVDAEVDELKGLFAGNEISDVNEDNFFEPRELRQKVLPKLSDPEKADLDRGVAALERNDDEAGLEAYRNALQAMLENRATFAPHPPPDGRSRGTDAFSYPLTLEVETDLLPSPADTAKGDPYELAVDYFSSSAPGPTDHPIFTDVVTINAAKFNAKPDTVKDPAGTARSVLQLTLEAPAEAASLTVRAASNLAIVDAPARSRTEDGAALLKALLPYRWRRVLLSHANEWSPQTVDKLFTALKSRGMLPQTFDVSTMLPLAWWRDDAAARAGRVKADALKGLPSSGSAGAPPPEESVVPVGSGAQSLFTTTADQLPINGKVDNLHPVTLVWLLEILSKRNLLNPRTSWEVGLFSPETKPPFAWGWLFDSPPRLGDVVRYMVVAPDYGYDVTRQARVSVSIGSVELPLFSGPYRPNGFVLEEVLVDFWGTCKLSVPGAAADPDKPLNTVTLQIPAPELDAVTPSEKQSGEYRTLECSESYIVPIKLKGSSPMPQQIHGVVGVQLSRDGGRTWRDATISGERVFTEAFARTFASPAPGESPIAIGSDDFVIENETIVGRTPKGRAKNNLRISGALRYEDLRLAQNSAGIRISVSLAVGVQRLHGEFKRAIELKEVERSGKRAVLSTSAKEVAAKVRLAEIALTVFPRVRVPGETALLTQARLSTADAALKKQLSDHGVEVAFDSLETKDALLSRPGCPPLRPLHFSADGLYIEGFDAATNPAGQVTDGFTFGAYGNACALWANVGLVQALDKLYRTAASRPKLTSLDRSGRFCSVAGTNHAAAARDCKLFGFVAEDAIRNELILIAGRPTTYYASVDVRAVLEALYPGEVASGATAFRLYFSPSNGLARGDSRHRDSPPYYLEGELPTVAGGRPPANPTVGCDDAVGTLRPLGFGNLDIKLVGKNVQVYCQLTGNRMAWAPFRVKLTQTGGGQPKPASQTVEIHSGDELLQTQFPLANNAVVPATYTIAAELKSGHPPVAYPAPAPPAPLTYDFAPALLPPPGETGLHIEPVKDLLLVWCRCRGLEAPPEGNATLAQARSGSFPKLVVASKRTVGRELILEITPAGTPEPHTITYLVASDARSGYPNHDGIFCALVKRTGSFVAGTTYTFEVKRPHGAAPIRTSTSVTRLAPTTYQHSD